jgi:hypothetical protein
VGRLEDVVKEDLTDAIKGMFAGYALESDSILAGERLLAAIREGVAIGTERAFTAHLVRQQKGPLAGK